MGKNTVHDRPAANADAEMALRSYLDRYSGGTLTLYDYDMNLWFKWCMVEQGVQPLDVKRMHLEAFGRWLQTEKNNSPRSTCRRLQVIRTFYRLSAADDIISRDPSAMMRMPKWQVDRSKIAHTTPTQVVACLAAAEKMSPSHAAVIALMAYLGMRVSEACGVQIDDFSKSPDGHRTLTYTRKGGKVATVPVPPPLRRYIKAAKAGRKSGALIVSKRGLPQNRRGVYDWVKRICKAAELPQNIHPHSFRHGTAKALLAAGMTLEEVQHFMGHADIRTTIHYAQREYTLDQHGAHVASRIFSLAA